MSPRRRAPSGSGKRKDAAAMPVARAAEPAADGDDSDQREVDAEILPDGDSITDDLAALIPKPTADEPEAPKSPGALVTYDPLQRYLQEIRRYSLLTREEEHALAVRYQADHDIEAAYRLVTSNLRLVVMIARE